jgi:hypothetical protein
MGQPTINLEADLLKAMKAKEATKVATLRLLVAAIKNNRIEKGADLSDTETVSLLQKEAKKRQESIEAYKKAGRQELVDQENGELQLIKEYLPVQMDECEIRHVIEELKNKGELSDDFGANMKTVMKALQGKADGGMVAGIVKQML